MQTSSKAFAGRVAIVTGGASGMGLALCRRLVDGRAAVLVADVDGVAARERAAELGAGGGRVSAATVDVTDRRQVEDLVGGVVARWGRLDLMFNNAGIGGTLAFHRAGPEHWERIVAVNLWGVAHGTVAAYRHMAARGCGHIVNTASISGLVPWPGQVLYNTTKFGVVGLSTTLRPEAARHGVRVSVVCPGLVDTAIFGVPILGPVDRGAVAPAGAIPADRAASEILAGVARNRAVIVFPARDRRWWRIQRHAPGLAASRVERWYRRGRGRAVYRERGGRSA